MTFGTAQDQVLLGTYPQQTKNYLSIFKPAVALACQVSGSYNTTDQTIPYDNVNAGSYTEIDDYMFQVALIGTASGLEDVGRTWVRSATASTLRFVESDHIEWANNLYITVLKYTEIIPVFPRIIQNPADEEDVIFYKIWDVAYTNQNTILGSAIRMGSHYAGFGTQVYWTASGTSNLAGDNMTYSWEFEGANITGSSSHTPGYVNYPGPGHYRTFLTVTSSSGAVDKSVRFVSLYDRTVNLPYLDWQRSEYGGSVDSRGYSCRITLRDPVPENTVLDGALVVIFSDDYYGYTQQSVSNNGLGRSHIKMVGYIESGTIQYNYADGSVEFGVVSPTKIMEICEGFSISVENSTNPTVWYEMYLMTIKKAIYHYLRWQSSVLLCNDVVMDFTDRDVQYFDADRTSLYDAIYSFLNGTLFGNMVSDKLGTIWMYQDISASPSGTTLPTALTVNKAQWIGDPVIAEKQFNEASFLDLGGIAYDNATNESTALLASAPGYSPAYHGKVDNTSGLALLNQAELNSIVASRFKYSNRRYPDVQIKLRGNYSNLDIVPQEKVLLNVLPQDTPRRVTWTNKPFVIRGISWSRDDKSQLELPTLSLSEIVEGGTGVTVSIPIEPPTTTDPGSGNGYTQPPITLPAIPPTVTPGTGGVNIYNNGTFVMTTDTLNFIGNIVYVRENTELSRADIFFEACDCSGTFLTSGTAGGSASFSAINTDNAYKSFVDGASQTLDLNGRASGTYSLAGAGSSEFFALIETTATFVIPAAGYYDIQFTDLAITVSPNSSSYNFDYSTTITIGSWTNTKSGTQVGFLTANKVAIFDEPADNIFFNSGDEITVTVTTTLTVNSGTNPSWWGVLGMLSITGV